VQEISGTRLSNRYVPGLEKRLPNKNLTLLVVGVVRRKTPGVGGRGELTWGKKGNNHFSVRQEGPFAGMTINGRDP